MDLLKNGQSLSIFFEKTGNIVEISCSIKQIYDDRMVIALPPYFMRYIEFLEEGKPLTVKVFTKVGTIDFNTVVISSPMEDEFAVELDYNAMQMVPTDDNQVINAMEKISIYINDEVYNYKTFEISVNYLKLYADNNKLNIGDTYKCDLYLPQGCGKIRLEGVITEIDPVYDNEFTLEYSMITENDKQKIVYYMYLYSSDID